MTLLKNALLMLLVIALGSFLGVFGARWLLAASEPAPIEQLDALPAQIAGHEQPVVFTLSTCPACAKLKQWMGERGLAFVEYSLDTDEQAARIARELGISAVPVIYTGRHRINGFSPQALDRLLAGAPGA